MEAGRPTAYREKNGGVRLEFTNSTTAGNHVREQAQQLLQQNWAEIGAKMTISNLPPAVMWGDYWMMSKFDSAMVGIDFMVGPDPDSTDFFASKSIGAKGRRGPEHLPVRKSSGRRIASPRVQATVDQSPSAKPPTSKCRNRPAQDLPYLPIFQYAMVQGVKSKPPGLYAPDVNVQENCYNANTWYWA